MPGDLCPSCGFHCPAAVLRSGPAARCPRCGDAVTGSSSADAATVTHTPETDPQPGLPPTVAAGDAATGPEPVAPPPSYLPAVPGYDLLGVLGRGGMGVVYKARQRVPRRVVALKMIVGGGAKADRFRTEIAAVARLQHPNVVRVHEVGEFDGRPYFSMEYVPGGTLADCLRAGPLSPDDAADLVSKLARAVQHAHDRNVVHRDLKPGNVLLAADEFVGDTPAAPPGVADCTPKIADFGLAKHLEGSADGPATRSGAILGTPSYMAPEQAMGKTRLVGPGVDVYALGAILYECLTGRPPFREDSPLDTLMKVVSDEAVPPRKLRPKVPRDLEVICQTCLRKEPGRRYATAGELADDLDRFSAGSPIAARARSLRERVGGWARRRREYLFLAAGVLLAGGLALAFLPGPRPVTYQQTDPTVADLPPDLLFVPADAFAFGTARPADLWGNDAVRDLLDFRLAQEGAGASSESLALGAEGITSIHPRDIERATAVLPNHTGGGDPLIILWTARPYSHDRLHDHLTRRGTHAHQDVGGRRMYVPTGPKRDMAFLLASDRVLVLGDPDLVYRAARTPAGKPGPLTPMLEWAARLHTVVVGVNPPTEVVEEWMGGKLRLDHRVEAVAGLRTIGVTADVGPVGPNGRVPIDVGGRVTFPNPDRAAAARPLMAGVVDRLLTHLTADSGAFPPTLIAPVLGPVRAAVWEQEGDALTGSARVELDPAEIKAELTEWNTGRASAANLRRIAEAMRQYHARHQRFPPAVVTDADGKPLYSWRVELLPYLGGETVHRRFHLGRAWDHPSNRPLLDQMPRVFAAPGAPRGTNTTPYQVLAGPGGLFDTPDGRRLAEIADGASRTLLVVEAPGPVPWTKPADVAVGGDTVPKLGGVVRSGFYAVTADGTVGFVPHADTPPGPLRGLFTRAGGEPVDFPPRP